MIQDYLKAGYPILLVRTHEPERFIGSAVQQGNGRNPHQWDVVRGFRQMGNGADWNECDPFDLPNMAARGTEKAVWFLRNFHFWLNEPQVIQAIQNNLPLYKTKGITLVIVSPDAKLPVELEREVVVLDFPLPTREELKSILAGLVESTGIQPEDEAAVLDAAPGLVCKSFSPDDCRVLARVHQGNAHLNLAKIDLIIQHLNRIKKAMLENASRQEVSRLAQGGESRCEASSSST
jgi:hypothetical protein